MMDGPSRRGPKPAEPAGGRSWRPSLGYLALALALVVGGLVYGLLSSSTPIVDTAATSASQPVAVAIARPVAPVRAPQAASGAPPAIAAAPASGAVPVAPPQISRTRDPNGDQTPDLSDFVNAGERPSMGEVIDRLHQAGVYGGLGAFSPPGTRPPLVGLAVPEDFVLPPGYVRHYQTTDDGQSLEAILMFSPDRPPLDASNRPIAIPPDRVVPPELAPPGLPIRRIVIPAPTEPGRQGR